MRKAMMVSAILYFGVLGSAFAAGPDMRTGVHGGLWCNYEAEFHLETKDRGAWIFRGHIELPETGERRDGLWIEQYDDNSLRIIRYLTGRNIGKTQVTQTRAPTTVNFADGPYYKFQHSRTYGIGCENASTVLYMKKVD